MELKIAENIRILRKKKKMTQEQLAEAMGMTMSAVSKWESGMTMPEISVIIQLAEFFDTSVDVLLGYQMKNETREQMLEQIKNFQDAFNYEEAIYIGERAMKKFPYFFDVVYQTALSYFYKGSAENHPDTMKKAQELLFRALSLMDQNKDPEISEWLIRNQIAESFLYLRQAERCVEVYKENNLEGINDARIAHVLSDVMKHHNEALPFAQKAFRRVIEELVTTMIALGSFYLGTKQEQKAIECLHWLIGILESLETESVYYESTPALITLYQSLAEIYYDNGIYSNCKEYLLKARKLAYNYDSTPKEDIRTCRFFDDRLKGKNYMEMNVKSMMVYLTYRLSWYDQNDHPDYYKLWNEVLNEMESM